MSPFFKKTALLIAGIVVLSAVAFVAFDKKDETPIVPIEQVAEEAYRPEYKVIGKSVEGRKIESYTYVSAAAAESGEKKHLLFVGGVHGGYEWNSVVLAYEFVDYFNNNPDAIADNLVVTVIPSANPDGVYKIIGKEGRFSAEDVPADVDTAPGRFNANNVDLNRNFDCKWKPESTWRGKTVSAGSEPFSEPEAKAVRDFVLQSNPKAVIFWHSQADAVYASECKEGILAETLDIMNLYAKATGYKPVESFDHYEINGDAEGWLASIGIPAITVELKTHETIEWERNLKGVKAIIDLFSRKP